MTSGEEPGSGQVVADLLQFAARAAGNRDESIRFVCKVEGMVKHFPDLFNAKQLHMLRASRVYVEGSAFCDQARDTHGGVKAPATSFTPQPVPRKARTA